MKRAVSYLICAVIIAFAVNATATGQGRGGGPKVHGPKTTMKSVPGGPKAITAPGPKTTAAAAPKATPARTPKTVSARAPKAASPQPPKATKASAKPSKTNAAATRPRQPESAPAATTPAIVTTPATASTSTLPKNTRLVERLRLLLPPGTDVTLASTGFKNQGQFVAAVHVSRNLGIPFIDLRARMVDSGMSLGQAIQSLRPRAVYDAEAVRAFRQANADINAASIAPKRVPSS